MKNYYLLYLFLVPILGYSQVGINTQNPNAALDVRATGVAAESGILVPQLDEFPPAGTDQNGLLIFITGNGAPLKGYWYYTHATTSWTHLEGDANTDDQNLSVGNGTGTTSILQIENGNNVTFQEGANIQLTESGGNTISIAATGDGIGTDDQNLSVGAGTGTTSVIQMENGDDVTFVEGAGIELTENTAARTITITASNNSNTLDEAYDEGGAGAGRIINATNGAVRIDGTDGFLVTGTEGSGSIPASGAGVRMMFYPNEGAFRAGEVTGTDWDAGNIGENSGSIGYNNLATGRYSFSAGALADATGDYSVSMGRLNLSSGPSSTTFGVSCDAAGIGSFAAGENAQAIGNRSIALGSSNSGGYADNSWGIGHLARAQEQYALAMGRSSTAEGRSSTSIGSYIEAESFGEFVCGIYDLDYNESSETAFVGSDRIFTVGNGTNNGTGRNDAFIIFKNGDATLDGTLTQTSDKRQKKDIVPLVGALDKVLSLNGYNYYWKDAPNKSKELQIGVMAQEVQELFPEMVATSHVGELSVNYSGFAPILIEAMKEQQKIIEEQNKKFEQQQKLIKNLEQRLLDLEKR